MAYRRKPRGVITLDFSEVVGAMETGEYTLPDLEFGVKVSNSRVKKWNSCKRAHHYAFNEKIERKAPPTALYKGKIIHECIEDMIYKRDWTKTLGKYIDEYNKMFEEEKEQYGDLPNELRIIMEGYEKLYKDDGLEYLELNGKRAEHDFAIEIAREPCLHCENGFNPQLDEECTKCGGTGQRPIFLVGKIDAVARDREGRVWLVEHKSFKNLPDENFRWTNQQASLYTWVMPQIGFPKPDGVLWDYIRTKVPRVPEPLKSGRGLSKSKNIDTTYDTYYQAIIDNGFNPADYEDILEHLKGNEINFYRRIYLPTRDSIIKPIVDDVINTAKEIYYLGETLKTRNLGKDCSFCSFKQICQVEIMGGDSEFIKKSEYRPSRYHVVAEESEEE